MVDFCNHLNSILKNAFCPIILVLILCHATFNVYGQCTDFTSAALNPHTYTVPDGVTMVTITARGGHGGDEPMSTGIGGSASEVTATYSVTPGDVLNICVAEDVVSPAGSTDPTGPGGGSSGVVNTTTSTVLIVAGGGGGATFANDGGGGRGLIGGDPISPSEGNNGGGGFNQTNTGTAGGEEGTNTGSCAQGGADVFGNGATGGDGWSGGGGPIGGGGGGYHGGNGEAAAGGFSEGGSSYVGSGTNTSITAGMDGAASANVKAIVSICEVPLPVKLLSFTAHRSTDGVALHWITATEVNSDHFVAERSLDAMTWQPVGTVVAAGNSSQEQYYDLLDVKLENGQSYFYRLLQVDFDGTHNYSEIIVVSFEGHEETVKLSSNPIKRGEPLTLFGKITTVKIYSIEGHLMHVELVKSVNSSFLETDQLPSGMYFVEINGRRTDKLIVQE